MKIENYLAKFYDVNVRTDAEIDDGVKGVRHIEIYEKGEDCEPIGWFVKLDGKSTYEWRNVYGKVLNKTVYADELAVKAAAKAKIFYK